MIKPDKILIVLGLLFKQQLLCKKYNMTDPRFPDALRNVAMTFFNRTFYNLETIMESVVETMTSKYYLENETVCVSYGNAR